ncbi:MAG: carbon-nitrogen hydrolase family protein [Trueperaceae bacterium]
MQGISCTLDVAENTEKLLQAMEATLDAEPDLLVLSELANVPMFTSESIDRHFQMAESIPGPTTEKIREFCARSNVHVVFPMFERAASGRYFNSAAVISPEGLIEGTLPDGRTVPAFRKLHIPASTDPDGSVRSNEKFYFYPGPGFAAFDTKLGRLGILICWDKRYAEAWRIWGLLGASIVINPIATWGTWRGSTYLDELRIAAMNNQYYVVGCARAGRDSIGYEKAYVGGAHIVGPDGNVLSSQPDEIEGHYIWANLDLSEVDRHRRMTPIYRDRRPELYSLLTDNRF